MSVKSKKYDGKFGEAYGGDLPNGVHINVVLSERGSNAYAETIRSLASPSKGHVPFLACLGANQLVRPTTIVVNKVTLEDEEYGRFFSGAAQIGLSQGVLDAVKEGYISKEDIEDLALLVACWVDPDAKDETSIRLNSRRAMFDAIVKAIQPVTDTYVQQQLTFYESARNNFYKGD
ncbi:formaldehyde-activating enzyme [Halobacillus salinarum]|uniref:Formaldehyde-activating enzyme n=1 Tax=Halobacillus salinarum TaxID=2932257 RepID=A0ABY4EL28_9BACI|nr:formaldehyde-activating enzyme [Halobacillus salinarum]UOQ44267.1 formaldehyde-activating enzyme [Halobacillus salinarum]